MNKGYISLFLVLSISIGVSAAVYYFFEQHSYYLFLRKDEFIFETRRMVTKVCLSAVKEYVYAGQTEEEIKKIFISKHVFNAEYSCTVVEAAIQFEGEKLNYHIALHTPFGLKNVTYIFAPGLIERKILSL